MPSSGCGGRTKTVPPTLRQELEGVPCFPALLISNNIITISSPAWFPTEQVLSSASEKDVVVDVNVGKDNWEDDDDEDDSPRRAASLAHSVSKSLNK